MRQWATRGCAGNGHNVGDKLGVCGCGGAGTECAYSWVPGCSGHLIVEAAMHRIDIDFGFEYTRHIDAAGNVRQFGPDVWRAKPSNPGRFYLVA